MPSTPAPARRPVSITVNGRLYRGTYVVVGSTITVSALGQSETTQSGSMPVEDLARHILTGIVHTWTPMPGLTSATFTSGPAQAARFRWPIIHAAEDRIRL